MKLQLRKLPLDDPVYEEFQIAAPPNVVSLPLALVWFQYSMAPKSTCLLRQIEANAYGISYKNSSRLAKLYSSNLLLVLTLLTIKMDDV